MKNKVKQQIFVSVIFVLIVALIYKLYNPTIIKVPVQVQPNVINYPEPIRERVREREFRGPPIKQYKPGFTQQMGIITGPNEETLPIYGKEVRGRRDRYHYYTTTGVYDTTFSTMLNNGTVSTLNYCASHPSPDFMNQGASIIS